MNDTTHLTEEERQTLADGTIAADREAAARAHLLVCAECADDVARLEQLTMRARHLEDPTTDLAELWPGIRSRIENAKLVTLAPDSPSRRWRRPRPVLMVVGLVVMALWLTGFVCWIIYWVQMAGYGRRLREGRRGYRTGSVEEDYDDEFRGPLRDRDDDEFDESADFDRPRRRRREDDEDGDFDRPRRRRDEY